jgi:plastocyanin
MRVHQHLARIRAASLAATLGWVPGCGSSERQAPTTDDLVIEMAPENSGNAQVGIAGEPLPADLRARVVRDGLPVAGVRVYWSTGQGSMNPTSALTGADGISASRWTTKFVYVEQEAYASLDSVTEPRVPGSILEDMIQYTGLAFPDPDGPNTVQVRSDGEPRFDPASITIAVGDTVNWFWIAGTGGHNVVPDDGNAPATSGAPAAYPKYLSFRFMNPGVYRYHCATHGAAGGVGMSGVVTVLAHPPEARRAAISPAPAPATPR